MKLYSYFRSSASYRVRIALNLKNLDYEQVAVHLLRAGQFAPDFAKANPAKQVPVLDDESELFSQSLAIIEYLDEKFPEPPLLPRSSAADRAQVRSLALAIACDIHPLNNLRVLKYLVGPLGLSEERKNEWARHWIALGFAALEAQLSRSAHHGGFCFGDAPTLADCCLVPQIANAARVGLDMAPYATLRAIDDRCAELEAFRCAHPSVQPDAE